MTDFPVEEPREARSITKPVPREDYEAPRIETVLTPEEMSREVLYAGRPSVL